MNHWSPPDTWLRISTIDAHAAGEPLRIVTAGVAEPAGSTMLAKRDHARSHLETVRRLLMWEPRGHADMYGCILTEPVTEDGDVGALFLHNEGFSTMCGHGIIALVTVGVATGRFDAAGPETVVRIDTPAGRVTATAHVEAGVVTHVAFENVPSFVLVSGAVVPVPGIGDVRCDVAYGGAFYAYVDAEPLGMELSPRSVERIVDLGRRIKEAVVGTVEIVHPDGGADLNFLYGTIFVGPAEDPGAHSRNVCVFADGEVDRSPTGTGVSGRLAIHHARGELAEGEPIVVESILGSRFAGRIVGTAEVGGRPAVVPEVSGSAWITGRHEFFVDPADPLAGGFLLG